MHARIGLLLVSAFLVSACPPSSQTGVTIVLVPVGERTLSDGRIERELTIQMDNRAQTTATLPRRIVATQVTGGEIVEGEVVVPAAAAGAVVGTPDTMTVRMPSGAPLASIKVGSQWFPDENGPWQSASLGASGGTIAVPNGSAGAIFAGFGAGTAANLYEVDVPSDRALFTDTARIFTTNGADPKALRIEVWQAPAGEWVHVWMTPPAGGRTLWVRVPESDVEEFVPIPTAARSGGAIEGDVPAAAFAAGGANGSYEALVLTAVPTAHPRSGAVTHYCPLPSCVVTSGFSDARVHPVLGITRPHYGVDYRASEGTTVTASAAGTVERSYTSATFGETIIVRHADGSATLYAHLSRRDVFAGDVVQSREEIGLSGDTGTAEAPHLHFELVLEGSMIGGNRVDPVAYVALPTYTVELRAVQHNYSIWFWGTLNAILFDGTTRAYFGEEALGDAELHDVAAGTHTIRIGYAGGGLPQDTLGGYQVEASIEGGTWTSFYAPSTPTYDVFALTPSWYPGIVPDPEGTVWKTYTVTVP